MPVTKKFRWNEPGPEMVIVYDNPDLTSDKVKIKRLVDYSDYQKIANFGIRNNEEMINAMRRVICDLVKIVEAESKDLDPEIYRKKTHNMRKDARKEYQKHKKAKGIGK